MHLILVLIVEITGTTVIWSVLLILIVVAIVVSDSINICIGDRRVIVISFAVHAVGTFDVVMSNIVVLARAVTRTNAAAAAVAIRVFSSSPSPLNVVLLIVIAFTTTLHLIVISLKLIVIHIHHYWWLF